MAKTTETKSPQRPNPPRRPRRPRASQGGRGGQGEDRASRSAAATWGRAPEEPSQSCEARLHPPDFDAGRYRSSASRATWSRYDPGLPATIWSRRAWPHSRPRTTCGWSRSIASGSSSLRRLGGWTSRTWRRSSPSARSRSKPTPMRKGIFTARSTPIRSPSPSWRGLPDPGREHPDRRAAQGAGTVLDQDSVGPGYPGRGQALGRPDPHRRNAPGECETRRRPRSGISYLVEFAIPLGRPVRIGVQ